MTTSPPRPRPDADGESRPAGAIVGVRRLFRPENANYFLLLGTTLFLVIFGLVMVLSSSAVTSFIKTDDFFSVFSRQGLFAVLAVPVMLIASRMPSVFWRRWSGIAMMVALGLQFLVVATPLGVEEGGNRNWIILGGFVFQPSELLKVALVIWLGMILAKKGDRLDEWKEVAMPAGLLSAMGIGLVVLGRDVGTAIVLVCVVFGALFFAGVRLRILAIPAALIAFAGFLVITNGGNRADRFDVWQTGCSNPDDYMGLCWQTLHGWWALASGGVFGVGLGNSKSKWSWLPAAENDFIFAIIGEELGLLGALVVLALLVIMAIAFLRIIRSREDQFARITVAAIMVWILGQAFINIAVVLGLLPVLGVPLPLVSAGGSSLVTTMLAVGIALSFARAPSHAAPSTPPARTP